MKIISSKYLQKWYNIVDDVLEDKAFNIIEEHRAQMLDSLEKTYKEGEDEDVDMFVQALENIYYCNFDIALSDEDAEKLDVLINFRESNYYSKAIHFDNIAELNRIYWDLQRELHELLEIDIREIIDLSNSDDNIAEEIIEATNEMFSLIQRTEANTTKNTRNILSPIADELYDLRFAYDGYSVEEYDADIFRYLDLVLNLPKHIADKDFRDEETLWQGWRDITGQLKRAIENHKN